MFIMELSAMMSVKKAQQNVLVNMSFFIKFEIIIFLSNSIKNKKQNDFINILLF